MKKTCINKSNILNLVFFCGNSFAETFNELICINHVCKKSLLSTFLLWNWVQILKNISLAANVFTLNQTSQFFLTPFFSSSHLSFGFSLLFRSFFFSGSYFKRTKGKSFVLNMEDIFFYSGHHEKKNCNQCSKRSQERRKKKIVTSS